MSLDSLEPIAITGAALLALCERSEQLSPPSRALAILRAAYPSLDETAIANELLGSWNGALLRARVASVGSTLEMLDRCPGCSERIEFSVGVASLVPKRAIERTASVHVACGELHAACRALTGRDWLEAFESSDDDWLSAGKRMLSCGVESVVDREGGDAIDRLTQDAWEAIARALTDADPLSEIVFDLKCPRCAHAWDVALDPGEYLFRELAASGRRLLLQIHALATAYGWTEREILELSPSRRASYLRLIEELDGSSLAGRAP